MRSEGQRLTGADVLVRDLVAFGVDTVFSITGAGNLAIVDAIYRRGGIQMVYAHHEQAVVMAAQGYSRASGKMGVALVTTGGGAANALTGALSAQLDSIPVLLITGNESSFHVSAMGSFRAYGVQGFDSVSVFGPIVKHSSRVSDVADVSALVAAAWESAFSARPGVAHLDFPMDLQRRPTEVTEWVASPVLLQGWAPTSGVKADETLVRRCAAQLGASVRPLLYFGNGVRHGGARELALELVEKYQIPFVLSWSGIDLIEDSHPLNMGRVGIYGDRAANLILQSCDLLVSIGTRLAIPQVGYDQADFARNADRWVVDVDPVELSKFHGDRWNRVHSTSTDFLRRVTHFLDTGSDVARPSAWTSACNAVWTALPREQQIGPGVELGFVHSSRVMEYLNGALAADAVVVTDVGAGLLSGHYSLRPRAGQRVFTSQGLGEMGFGLPGAVGAYFADQSRQLVCLSTDGGIMFNLQELQTLSTHKIPMKLFIFNNAGYSMIRISQENLFDSRFSGIGPESGVGFPDFADLARTFKMAYVLVDSEGDFEKHIAPALASEEAVLIEIRMSPTQKYLPRLATRRLPDGSLTSPPLEDLDPPLPPLELERLLSALVNSAEPMGRSSG